MKMELFKGLAIVFWPGIMAILYSLIYLSEPYTYMMLKFISFVYISMTPFIVILVYEVVKDHKLKTEKMS